MSLEKNTQSQELNLLFLGNFPFPCGMAGTKRVKNTITALKSHDDIKISVLTLRGSSHNNYISGSYQNISYRLILPDTFRLKALILLPYLWIKTIFFINQARKKLFTNIIYVYDSPNLDNILPVLIAKLMGWKIVFDIVEDEHTAMANSSSLYHKATNMFTCFLTNRIAFLASGLIVISSHLEKKFSKIISSHTPIFLLPISIDINKFQKTTFCFGEEIQLFYAGSFGLKDGVENLIAAFNILSGEYDNIFLTLSGKGSNERMKIITRQIEQSPAKKRIIYKGYLSDDQYYSLLDEIDIPCMTRIDSAYANAGFPFKLGEFLATGKPVIASSVSDVKNLLKNKYNVMLVEPGNIYSIVEAVHFLKNSPEKASTIGEMGYLKAKELFDLTIQSQSLYHFLRKLK